MTDLDIIGDVHGCATKLEELLTTLGYTLNDWTGAYWHPERTAIFVGDLVDRGEEQLRVLEDVKRMVDGGSAQVVMGNHEFNAIAYAIEHPAGSGPFADGTFFAQTWSFGPSGPFAPGAWRSPSSCSRWIEGSIQGALRCPAVAPGNALPDSALPAGRHPREVFGLLS
jgi:hypothetical protein